MLTAGDLMDRYSQVTMEIKSIVNELNQYKNQPDCDHKIVKDLYNKYLEKKDTFKDIEIQYQHFIKYYGVSV